MLQLPTRCPACDADCRRAARFIAFCSCCGHRWLPTTAAEQEAIESGIYTHDYSGYRPDAKFIETAKRVTASDFVTRVAPPGRILDVGCGAGDFMGVAKEFGYSVEGIDISEASAEICRSRGHHARSGNFLTEQFSGKFDLITMWDVVEHLRNPAAFLERAGSLLSDRGVVFAKIPGFGNLSVAISNLWPRTAGTLLGSPSHVQYFDRESLSHLLLRTGFASEWIGGGGARSPVSGGSLKKRMARKAKRLISRASGDANFYLLARPL